MRTWDKELPDYEPFDVDKLFVPVPGLTLARERKAGYRDYPIDSENPLFNEELVDLAAYGIAGQNYYSRPNAATGEPVTAAKQPLMVRKSVADKLSDINNMLTDPVFTDFFGGRVELYAEDAFREPAAQRRLHDIVFPALIRKNHPGISDDELRAKLKNLIAKPSHHAQRPSPHATGGAVDVILRYAPVTATPDYVAGAEVPMGHTDGDTSERVMPDYFEMQQQLSEEDKLARRNRRAFYAVMTGKAFGADTGLQVNPTEWWHWSFGDQMWAKLRREPAAIYGLAKTEE